METKLETSGFSFKKNRISKNQATLEILTGEYEIHKLIFSSNTIDGYKKFKKILSEKLTPQKYELERGVLIEHILNGEIVNDAPIDFFSSKIVKESNKIEFGRRADYTTYLNIDIEKPHKENSKEKRKKIIEWAKYIISDYNLDKA